MYTRKLTKEKTSISDMWFLLMVQRPRVNVIYELFSPTTSPPPAFINLRFVAFDTITSFNKVKN